MSKKQALLVGINAYKGSPLRGCINDVVVIHNILTKQFGFKHEDIKVLTDHEATKKNIIDHIKWLTDGVSDNDSIVFHFSGHGSQVVVDDITATDEVDGLDEILIPYDHSWSNPFRDHELGSYFKKVPKSCTTLVILDNCHAGAGLRNDFSPVKINTGDDWVNRFIPPPISNTLLNPSVIVNADLSFSFPDPSIDNRATRNKFLIDTAKQGDTILLAGCEEGQTSADAWINNRYQGAMTYALAAVLNAHNYDITYKQLILEVNNYMNLFKYEQNPQLECKPEFFDNKFLK